MDETREVEARSRCRSHYVANRAERASSIALKKSRTGDTRTPTAASNNHSRTALVLGAANDSPFARFDEVDYLHDLFILRQLFADRFDRLGGIEF
jgi:hypothetical protein